MQTHPSSRARRFVARFVIGSVCAALFGNAPMTIAFAEAESAMLQAQSAVSTADARISLREATAQDVREAASLTLARVSRLARASRLAREIRLRAAQDALFRDEHSCPVDHPRLFSDDWGASRPGHHVHLGNDVVAPFGTPIRAPIDGFVTRGADPRGGTILKLWGDGGHFYMAHLSTYGKSGRVRHGDIIGYVGDSGEAKNGPPHDHVEWHPGNGPAVDPYPMLVSLCYPRTYADVVIGLRLMGLPNR